MRWARILIVGIILATFVVIGLTLWQVTSAPLPVPHVKVVRVPVPGPATVNRYYYMLPGHPALPTTSTTSGRPPVTAAPRSTTTTHSTSTTTTTTGRTHPSPKSAPCATIPVAGICLP